MADKFSLDERLVGLGMHATHADDKIMTFTRVEIEKFLNMVDMAIKPEDRDDRVAFVVEISIDNSRWSDHLPPMDEYDLRVLLQDAVGEFPNERSQARAYVAKRYSETITDQVAFERKVDEVERRVRWARGVRFHSIKKVR